MAVVEFSKLSRKLRLLCDVEGKSKLLMGLIRMTSCVGTYLREVSVRKLRGACVAMYIALISVMWSCQLGPAVSELEHARRELEHQSAHDELLSKLRRTQTDVQMLRAEVHRTFDLGDRPTHMNKAYSYLESMAAYSGLRIKLFETERQGFIQHANSGFSKVALEGLFTHVVKFAEALAVAPATLRLDIFQASVTEDMPETISLSLSISDVMEASPDPRECDDSSQ